MNIAAHLSLVAAVAGNEVRLRTRRISSLVIVFVVMAIT